MLWPIDLNSGDSGNLFTKRYFLFSKRSKRNNSTLLFENITTFFTWVSSSHALQNKEWYNRERNLDYKSTLQLYISIFHCIFNQ